MKIVLAQINPTVGDILGNYKKIVTNISKYNNKLILLFFQSCQLADTPLEDLVLKDRFLYEIKNILDKLEVFCLNKNIAIILGAPLKKIMLFIMRVYLYKKKKNIIYKNKLPNYGVFDEKRVFKSGKKYNTIKYKGVKIGIINLRRYVV